MASLNTQITPHVPQETVSESETTTVDEVKEELGVVHELPSKTSSVHQVADGGTKAWMTLAGSFIMIFCASGHMNAFGVYEDYYTREFLNSHSSSKIAWIGSLQVFLLGSLGIPGGYAMDRGYFHTVMLFGSTLLVVSLLATSFAQPQQWWQIFLSQGLGFGIGVGTVYIPSLGILSHHFKRRRSLAMGIAGSGVSAGGIVYPIMLNYCIHGRVGFRWGIRISAFVTLALLILANLMMSTTLPPRTDGKTLTQQVAYWRVFFKDGAYLFATASVFLLYASLYFPTFYLQLKAITNGVDHTTAFWTIVVLNGAGFFGRILPNFFVDKTGVWAQLTPCAVICGALMIAFIGIHDAAGIMTIAVLYGFFNGAIISLLSPMLAYLTHDVTEIGARMGACIGIGALGALIGPPVSGELLTGEYHWWRPAVFSGVCCAITGVTFNMARIISARDAAKREQKE
ncbi:MFS general substrate transporter [Pterulicium gracile]|uniref:MFS general substrate transporter n=1 Tax=Pterulicium gracile TaxID=1884261 RepID=A0A5C3QCT5_9AGAR|nr:MFS general substrate transporter [Pterula gracilis]